MSYPKKLAQFRPSRGLVSSVDTPAYEVGPDFWTDLRNVHCREGFASRVLGHRAAYGTLPVNVWHMLNARRGSTNYWLMFGDEDVHALETLNSDDVTPAGGLTPVAQPWQWSTALLGGVPCFSNGLDVPHYWAGNPAAPFEPLPGWPEGMSCKTLAAFRYHLFALDIDGPDGAFEDLVMWSDAAEPGAVPQTWTPAADNEAGSAPISDTPGPVLMGLPLRGSFLIYKRSSVYAATYVQDPEQVFAIAPLFSASGVLTRHGACDINGEHFVVTDGDVIRTDGTNRRSVAKGRVQKRLFSQLDQDYYENLFVTFNRAQGEVWVCFPEAGNQRCTKALVYDVAADAFGERDLPEATCAAVGIVNDEAQSEDWDDDAGDWDDDTSYWNAQNFSFATESLLIGFETTAQQQDTDDAQAVPALLAKYDMDLGDAARVKFVRRVHVRKDTGAGPLEVRLGARFATDEDIRWTNPRTLNEGEQTVNLQARGRYLSVEIRSAGAQTWRVSGFDIEFEPRGYF